jgi:peptidoglycan hydrolase-like protein with peptidoglycan-binding domain
VVQDRSVPAAPVAPATKASPSAKSHPPPPQPRASRSRPIPASIANERTRRLQIALARHGFYAGPLNGVADGSTESAIRAYQASLGDPATGRLSPTEIVHLLDNE